MEKHVTILGILHIARGAIVLIIGIIAWLVLAGIGAISRDPVAFGILGLIGTAAATFMVFLSIPSILAGIGVIRRHEWGRILALVVGGLSLVDFPIGTALGVYTIWVLVDTSVRTMFAARPAGQQNPAGATP